MIIKGKSITGPEALAPYLENAEKNERVSVLEIKGTVAQDLIGALQEMDAYAEGTSCKKPLYHAKINPEPPHRLTPEQRMEAVEALEQKLGLVGHARAVVMHEKFGREHFHVVWTRIDVEKMRAVGDSHNYRKHEDVSRDLERRFGHNRVQGVHAEREDAQRPDRTPSRAELRQEDRTGIKGKDVKAEVTAAFKASDSPEAFRTALEDAGYVLAKGDKRDFVVVDRAGDVHSLARRIDDVKTVELREFMKPLSREWLPTVEMAKRTQIDRAEGRTSAIDTKQWDDAVAKASIDKVKRADAETERRKAELRASRRKAKGEKSYARGDDYVSQSTAALNDNKNRQKKLNKKNAEPRPQRPVDESGVFERMKLNPKQTKVEGPNRPSMYERMKAQLQNIEMTDRKSRQLDREIGIERSSPIERDPDRQREAPGGGRTRGR